MAKTMLFNPYTGKPRDPRDIASDPDGKLMVDPDEPLRAASKFSCYLQRDHGKAPCDHDCGKLRCMYPSKEASKVEPVADEPAMVIAMDEGEREPRIVSWNAFPVGTHWLYTHPATTHSAPQEASKVADGGDAPQALSEDTKRLDYLQQRGATVELLPPVNGPAGSFRIGGHHKAVSRDIREAIDLARAILAAAGGGEK